MIDVIIPTKSNFDGLFCLIPQLQKDDSVEKIVVICDGDEAFRYVTNELSSKMKVFMVDLSIGIHKMWNVGIQYLIDSGNVQKGNHVAFINDDVLLGEECMSIMASLLDSEKSIGLATPSWTEDIKDGFVEITAFGGFCMCVQSELIKEWRFDEEMKWWYGDNDIISWVTHDKGLRTGIFGKAQCYGNKSATIVNDPPKDFQALINNDARIYHEKWDEKIALRNISDRDI
jgi:hypothetical protein